MAFPRPYFRRNKAFWIGLLGAAVIVVLMFGSSAIKQMGFGHTSIDVEFAQAAGMKTGDKVKVAGIDVGEVKSLELEGDHVLAVVDVQNDLNLGPDARATIKMSTLLGAHYVELDPGDGSGLPDDRIPVENTNVPYDLSDIVQIGTPKFEAIDADKIAESLELLNRQLGDSPGAYGAGARQRRRTREGDRQPPHRGGCAAEEPRHRDVRARRQPQQHPVDHQPGRGDHERGRRTPGARRPSCSTTSPRCRGNSRSWAYRTRISSARPSRR